MLMLFFSVCDINAQPFDWDQCLNYWSSGIFLLLLLCIIDSQLRSPNADATWSVHKTERSVAQRFSILPIL